MVQICVMDEKPRAYLLRYILNIMLITLLEQFCNNFCAVVVGNHLKIYLLPGTCNTSIIGSFPFKIRSRMWFQHDEAPLHFKEGLRSIWTSDFLTDAVEEENMTLSSDPMDFPLRLFERVNLRNTCS